MLKKAMHLGGADPCAHTFSVFIQQIPRVCFCGSGTDSVCARKGYTYILQRAQLHLRRASNDCLPLSVVRAVRGL